jgi:hypothetical protein
MKSFLFHAGPIRVCEKGGISIPFDGDLHMGDAISRLSMIVGPGAPFRLEPR